MATKTRHTKGNGQKGSGQIARFFDDVEALARHVTRLDDEDIAKLRRRVESSLESARESFDERVRSVVESTSAAAKSTDKYVHASPWTSVGIAAVAFLALGSLLRRR